jgi:hypothetical protein
VDERLQTVEFELHRLAAELAHVQGRVAALEGERLAATTLSPALDEDQSSAGETVVSRPRLQAVAAALGQAFIGLGGAFLLRAITDAGLLSPALGVSAGLLYAFGWLGASARAARRGTPIDAGFRGAVAVLVAFPLVVEATLRFAIVPAGLAPLALSALSGLYLGVAWRERLHGLAWFTVMAALGTGLVLMARTGVVVPHAAGFVALGVATLWLGYDREWVMLRWPAAVVADLVVAGLLMRVASDPPLDPPGYVLAVQALLLSGYLGSTAVRTLVRGRNVIPFEVAQTLAVLVVGLGGGMWLGRSAAGGAAMGWVALLLAIAAYAVAFAFIDRQQGRGVNFYFYSSLALVCALAGTGALLSPAPRAVVWSVLAVAAAFAAGRFGRVTLAYHGSVYVVGAALAGGLLYNTGARLLGASGAAVMWPELVALAAAAVTCGLLPPAEPGLNPAWARGQAFVSTLVLLFGAIGLGAAAGTAAAGLAGPAPVPAAVSATVRTIALAGGAVLAARLALWPRLATFGLFVYPILMLTGVKLLIEDFRVSQPATLFVALAAFGAALVIAPRFTRSR